MKTKKSDIQLLIALLGILIAVCAYFFVYKKYMEKSDAMDSRNAELSAEVTRLETLNVNKETYLENTVKMKNYIAEFETHFPADILPEDSIMTVKHLEDNTRTKVASLSFGGTSEVLYQVQTPVQEAVQNPAAPGTQAAASETAEAAASSVVETDAAVYPDTKLYDVPVSISIECTYDDFKGLVRYIYAQNNRMSIRGVNISYNESQGKLSGNMTLDTYYLLGTDKAYVEPEIPNMKLGVDTIFGNME